jgi:hypothetical protein
MSLLQRSCLVFLICLPVVCWPEQNPAAQAVPLPPQAALPSAPQAPPLTSHSTLQPEKKKGPIYLDVVVTDKTGAPVSGLELKDFTLQDNGQPSKILSFQTFGVGAQKANPPVEVILLLDTVNEPFQQVSMTRQQIANFLLQNGGHLAQPVSLFVLTDKGMDVQHRPTYDGKGLARSVSQIDNHLRTIHRSAGFWGADERFQLSL